VKGELSGSESLYVDGKVEGAINLPGNRVTVGRNGQVAANIMAREIVVLGKVRGNCQASDRVDIRSEGSLTGDVVAARISIEDGAFFKGGIDIRKPGADAKGGNAAAASTSTTSTPEPAAAAASHS
jgi:cytoskeletal protein CcmA (bactofilin family)